MVYNSLVFRLTAIRLEHQILTIRLEKMATLTLKYRLVTILNQSKSIATVYWLFAQ